MRKGGQATTLTEELVLPVQFYAPSQARCAGEKRLHVAILDQALGDLGSQDRDKVDAAWVWLTRPGLTGEEFISVEACCEVLEIDVVALRTALGNTRQSAQDLGQSIARRGAHSRHNVGRRDHVVGGARVFDRRRGGGSGYVAVSGGG